MPRPEIKALFDAIDEKGGMDWVLECVENGLGVTQICREVGREHQRAWLSRKLNTEEYKQRYLEAKKRSADAIAERIMDVVNETTPDNAQAQRVKAENLRWYAIIRDREQYGEKAQPLVQVSVQTLALDALRKRAVNVDITPQIEAGEPNENG